MKKVFSYKNRAKVIENIKRINIYENKHCKIESCDFREIKEELDGAKSYEKEI